MEEVTRVEVKIGIADHGRELLVVSTEEPDAIQTLVDEALKSDAGSLVLVDEKGRKVIVPTARIAYVEIAPSDVRRVGFGA